MAKQNVHKYVHRRSTVIYVESFKVTALSNASIRQQKIKILIIPVNTEYLRKYLTPVLVFVH